MAAALFVIIAGLLAMVHGVLILSGVTIGEAVPSVLAGIPAWWLLATGATAAALGIFAYIHQAWLLTAWGIITALLSFGLLGTSSVVAVIAIWPFIRSFVEGEETRLDFKRMHSHEWPDKAIMASVVIASAGALAIIQTVLLAAGRIEPVAGPTWAWLAWSAAAGVLSLVAARHVFHLRNAWLGWTASIVAIVTMAFWIIGPMLAVVAMIYLALATKEAEFILDAGGTSAQQ